MFLSSLTFIPFLFHQVFLQVCNIRTIKIKRLILPIHILSQTTRLLSCWHSSIPAPVSTTAALPHKAESMNAPSSSSLPFVFMAYSKMSMESTLTSSLHLTAIYQHWKSWYPLCSLFKKKNKTQIIASSSRPIYHNTTWLQLVNSYLVS